MRRELWAMLLVGLAALPLVGCGGKPTPPSDKPAEGLNIEGPGDPMPMPTPGPADPMPKPNPDPGPAPSPEPAPAPK
jgi:hypothetical protein